MRSAPPSLTPQAEASDRWLSEDAAADHLGISVHYLRKLRYQNAGPPFVRLGRRILRRQSWCDEWMEANKVAA